MNYLLLLFDYRIFLLYYSVSHMLEPLRLNTLMFSVDEVTFLEGSRAYVYAKS